MDLSMERRSGSLRPEDVYWYYDAKRRWNGEWSKEELLSRVRELCNSPAGLLVCEEVPRSAVKYADLSQLYKIKRTQFDEDGYTFRRTAIHKISRIIYWGGYNAKISDEVFIKDPLKEVEKNPVFLCEYALSKGYGIRLTG